MQSFDRFWITSILLIHLFLSGILYLIAFWGTFDFDITGYIDIIEVPKSFIFPLIVSLGSSIALFLMRLFSLNDSETGSKVMSGKPRRLWMQKLESFVQANQNIVLLTVFCIGLFVYLKSVVLGLTIGALSVVIVALSRIRYFSKFFEVFPDVGVRTFVFYYMLLVPLISFGTGKINAVEIRDNKNYFKIQDIQFNSSERLVSFSSLKLLSKTDKYLFAADSATNTISVFLVEDLSSYTMLKMPINGVRPVTEQKK